MAAPTFVGFQQTAWNTSTSPKSTATISAAVGDVVVSVAGCANATGANQQSIAGNGVTLSLLQDIFTSTRSEADLYAGVVSSAGSVGATITNGGGLQFGGAVAVFTASAGIGASNEADGSTTGQISLTTTQANSAVLVFVADFNAIDGASRSWLSVNGAPTERVYSFTASQYTVYCATYADVGTAGAKTLGLSAPSGQLSSVFAVEIKGVAGPAITAQPESQQVPAGSTPQYSVTAPTATSYQWQSNVGGTFADISGATSSTYTTPALAAGTAYAVRVIVSDGTNNTTSDPAEVWTPVTKPRPWAGLYGSAVRNTSVTGWPSSRISDDILVDAIFSAPSSGGVESRSLTTAGVSSVAWQASQTEARTLASNGIGAASWQAVAIAARTFSAGGVGAFSPLSAAVVPSILSSSGVGAATWQATAFEARSFAPAGISSVSWQASTIEARALSSGGSSSVAWIGEDGQAATTDRTLSSAGSTSVAWQAVAIEARTFGAAGIATFAPLASQIEARALLSDGVGAFSPLSASIEGRTFTSAGTTTALFDGVDATGGIESRIFASAGSTAVAWQAVDANAQPATGGHSDPTPIKHRVRRQIAEALATEPKTEEAQQQRAQARGYVETLKDDIEAADRQITALRQQFEAMRAEREAQDKAKKAAKRAARASQQIAMALDEQLAMIRAQVAAEEALQAQLIAAEAIRKAAAIQLEEIDIAFVACVLAEA